MSYKKDFPIFLNNPWLVFLDSTSTTQKPSYVLEKQKKYLETSYSNIHRWSYSLAEKSEEMYVSSKKKVAELIWAASWREVIYTMNSTYAANLLTSSIRRSWILSKGDVILVSIVEHHANIVPWQILAEDTGAELQYIGVDDGYSLDMKDLQEKLKNPKLKIISLTHVSNVTGEIFPLEEVWKIIRELKDEVLFFVDASQSVPHFKVDVQKLSCDALFFTWHKIMADSGIGVLYGKEEFLKSLKPSISGGWAISWVKCQDFKVAGLPDAFEPGTPNLSGAMTLIAALEYIEQIWWYEELERIEGVLTKEMLDGFFQRPHIKIQWWTNIKTRVWVFSFTVDGIHSNDIADYLADNDICIRAGQHCAEPLMDTDSISGSCRASLYIYNTSADIQKFFAVLDGCIKDLS